MYLQELMFYPAFDEGCVTAAPGYLQSLGHPTASTKSTLLSPLCLAQSMKSRNKDGVNPAGPQS